jgi:hypothetical protein
MIIKPSYEDPWYARIPPISYSACRPTPAAVLEFDGAVRYGEGVLFGAGELKKP